MLRRHGGFTLIEILIVVIILGIMAAVAIPQFTNVGQTSRENTLRESVLQMRTQIAVYAAQHRDALPDATTFALQLTSFTNEAGAIGSGPEFRFGPYLAMVSPNPMNGMSSVKLLGPTEAPVADGTTGWLYRPGEGGSFGFWPNTMGIDTNGKAYTDY